MYCRLRVTILILILSFLATVSALGQGQDAGADLTINSVSVDSQGLITVNVTNDSTDKRGRSTKATISVNVWGGNQCPDGTLDTTDREHPDGKVVVTPDSGPDSCEERSAPGGSGSFDPGETDNVTIDMGVGPGEYLVFVDAWANIKGDTSRTKRGVAVVKVQ